MKVVLLDDVDGVGDRGETARVADGYARNFLIPRGKALRATTAAVKFAADANKKAEKLESTVRAEAEIRAAKIADLTITIMANAGEGGKLYGSVSAADVAEEIAKKDVGFEIDKRDVLLAEPIKAVGRYKVPVKLFRQVRPEIDLRVTSSDPVAAAPQVVAEKPETPEATAEPGVEDGSDGKAEASRNDEPKDV